MSIVISGLYLEFVAIIGDISITRFFGHYFWVKASKIRLLLSFKC